MGYHPSRALFWCFRALCLGAFSSLFYVFRAFSYFRLKFLVLVKTY